MKVQDVGNGLVLPDHTTVQTRVLDTIRLRAAELEGDGVNWTGSPKHGTKKRTVNIKMPSGAVLCGIGGELLVSALANGGVPVE